MYIQTHTYIYKHENIRYAHMIAGTAVLQEARFSIALFLVYTTRKLARV